MTPLLVLALLQTAPRPELLERSMALNRSGHWAEAAAAAREFLAAHPDAPRVESCEARFDVIYASARLGRSDDAREALAAFDGACAEFGAEHWLRQEVERLRAELGLAGPTVPPGAGDGFWRRADPAELGLDATVLARHRELCEQTGADACLVVRGRRIADEWYSPRYKSPMYAMSATKSITGLLVGMLSDAGKLALDDPVCKYLPAWCESPRSKVTLRHLLTHTSGLPQMKKDGVGTVTDKDPFVVALQLVAAPGARWSYSNEGVQLLSPILDAAGGEPIQDFARRRLFAPVGMSETRLHLDASGHAWTYADMETTPRDLARIGLLMLDHGRWNERQIVSSDWVKRSTMRSQTLNPRCGLLWWRFDDPTGFAALGYLDNNLYVFPGLDLVVVRMQSAPAPRAQGRYEERALPLFPRMILPAGR